MISLLLKFRLWHSWLRPLLVFPILICPFKNSTLIRPSLTQILPTHLFCPCGFPLSAAPLSLRGCSIKVFICLVFRIFYRLPVVSADKGMVMVPSHVAAHQTSCTALLVSVALLKLARRYDVNFVKRLLQLQHNYCNVATFMELKYLPTMHHSYQTQKWSHPLNLSYRVFQQSRFYLSYLTQLLNPVWKRGQTL